MIQNDDGTVSFVDVTDYSQVGDSFGAVDINATNEKCNEINNSLPKIYTGMPNGEFVKDVKDCSFILYPNIKRVDFQFVGFIKATIPDWTQLVKVPTDLQISEKNDSYCGTSVTSDGKIGICYISPSYNWHLVPVGISGSAVGEIVKLFGSYYIN